VISDGINALVAQNVLLIALVFARIGTAIILLPGFGENYVPPRTKISLGALISFALYASLPLPLVPDQPVMIAILFAGEALIGAYIAICGRLFITAIHVLGGILGFAIGLSNALAPNDGNFEGASALAGLLQLGAIAAIFATDTHHIVLSGLIRSYQAIPVATFLIQDMVEQIARLGANAFYIAVMIGAPFLLFTVVMNLALGLANRVMPTMQVFFVGGPGMIILGFMLLAIMTPAILNTVVGGFADWMIALRF